jgi:branched-chain amino acid transport system ATP-binding protein
VASPSTETRPPVLELQGVTRQFGALNAVDDVTFSVREGARHAVIGPNGAGKSTLLNLISGHLPTSSGTISFVGKDMAALSEDARARLGLAKTFQHSSLFNGLNAEDFGSSFEMHKLMSRRAYSVGLRSLKNRTFK